MSTLRLVLIDVEGLQRIAALMVGLVLFSAATRATSDAEGGGGCDERMAHVGCAGAVGGGGLIAKVVSKGADDAARVGLDVGGIAAVRGGSQAAKGADGGLLAAEAVLNPHWDEAAEVVGRMASSDGHLAALPDLVARHPKIAGMGADDLVKYADANPGFWQDAGVELYLRDPGLWADLGGDELLALAAVRSPSMRKAVRDVAVGRMDRAAAELGAVDLEDAAAVGQFEAVHGVVVARDAGKVGLRVDGPDYSYVLRALDVRSLVQLAGELGGQPIEELAVSERVRFDAAEAKRVFAAEAVGVVVREDRLDVAGLYAFREKQPGDLSVHWLGPGIHLRGGQPADFDVLVGLIGAGREDGVEPGRFAELWVGFHLALFSSVCLPSQFDPEVGLPGVKAVDDGLSYRFWTRESARSCVPREILVPPTGRTGG